MTAKRKQVRIAADYGKRTVTLRWRELNWYRPDGPWRQLTFPEQEFERALIEAKIVFHPSTVLVMSDNRIQEGE